jgi:hypothetical protein
MGSFRAVDFRLAGEAELDPVSPNLQDRHDEPFADHNLLSWLAAEHQHGRLSCANAA